MAKLELSQAEADALLAMEKFSTSSTPVRLPGLGGRLELNFRDISHQEDFAINFTRSSILLEKRNHHLRGRRVIGLARLDLDGPPHRNPDGVEVGPRHLHYYREGYGLKFAREVPDELFRDLSDSLMTLEDFMSYCCVTTPPVIDRELFS